MSQDSWFWNLVPLGLVRLYARTRAKPGEIRIGPDRIGPFQVAAVAGVLVRVPDASAHPSDQASRASA